MAAKTGHKMKLYRNTGSPDSPSWSLVDEVGDVSIPDLTRGLAELKRRASDFTKNLASLIQSIAIEFRLHNGLDETTFDAIRTNFFSGTAEEWACLSGEFGDSDTEGLRLPALVENFPFDQPLEDVAGHDVRLAVAYWETGGYELEPSWVADGVTSSTYI